MDPRHLTYRYVFDMFLTLFFGTMEHTRNRKGRAYFRTQMFAHTKNRESRAYQNWELGAESREVGARS